MKKQTHWITIPDEKLHTPVSGEGEATEGKEKTGEKPVRYKFIWGIGFAVLLVAVFALLAPSQFSALLRGSLFDTAGVTEEELKINLIPEKKTETITETPATPEEEVAPAAEETIVTKPQEEAVAISVTPVSVTPETVDCASDIDCFVGHLKDCSLAKGVMGYKISDKDFETKLEITGTDADNCLFTSEFTKSAEPTLIGQKADCKLKKGDYKKEDIEKVFSDKTQLTSTCTGDAADTLGKYLDSLAVATPVTEGESDQAKLIADLQKQINDLQKQREEDLEAMKAAQNNLYPSAGTPAGVTATTQIGQPQAVQPGFRANPYKVTVSPQQVLQQNTGIGGQYAQQTSAYQATGYQAYQQPTYYQTTVTSTATPQTGPSEILLITFALTFLGLLGWRLVRTFA